MAQQGCFTKMQTQVTHQSTTVSFGEITSECIRGYYCGAPTCADDVLLISSSNYDLQAMLTTVFQYSARNHYIKHPEKSQIITYGDASLPECFLCYLPDSRIHIGMRRSKDELVPTSFTEHRISTASVPCICR